MPLVKLLHDEEVKTRANAAGALGNLVRNSASLCQPLIEAGAPQVTTHTESGAPLYMLEIFGLQKGPP